MTLHEQLETPILETHSVIVAGGGIAGIAAALAAAREGADVLLIERESYSAALPRWALSPFICPCATDAVIRFLSALPRNCSGSLSVTAQRRIIPKRGLTAARKRKKPRDSALKFATMRIYLPLKPKSCCFKTV